jgi:hypothetical protein
MKNSGTPGPARRSVLPPPSPSPQTEPGREKNTPTPDHADEGGFSSSAEDASVRHKESAEGAPTRTPRTPDSVGSRLDE